MINSRAKGARGERQWRDQLRAEGYTAKRGQQFVGGQDSPDVICEELKGKLHFEVKCVQNLNLDKACEQAERDACVQIVENEAFQYASPVWAFEIVNDIKARGDNK